MLATLPIVESGVNFSGMCIKLIWPEGDTLTETERRPYLEVVCVYCIYLDLLIYPTSKCLSFTYAWVAFSI